MCFTLGAVMVKGGKIISSGHNHHRPHYDGAEVGTRGHRKPVSMHAEMHTIFNVTGMSPSFKKQVQGVERRAPQRTPPAPNQTKGTKGLSESEPRRLSWDGHAEITKIAEGEGQAPRITAIGAGWGRAWGEQWERKDLNKCWDARRRDPRVNGADIYVARFTKNGTGTAKPCWRCLEWCKWAGVKRIFHWNNEEGKFDVVKVNSAVIEQYETHADIRLFAGLGW
ncbi:hypothetical protein JAAARDRAFT_48384 [Jaapia argillacea MUCL 33604]|uniref:Uncharacterized protein n=1 Tax=Jaapia argillacea MUCL 33604 TaxID=933084 RepID=A0A067Q058_9AGAM|nr:hypothetical protein JAAARDRAFT_48384 [Jaapia argillacea MUCL 33604]